MLPAGISNNDGAQGLAGGNVVKVRKNDMADSEFCEGRRKDFAKNGKDLIFRWEWYAGQDWDHTAA